ncbi:MAG TPA: phosphoribosylanthranilate isomerase [Candidatus Aminicenantes bacterium]|nr:phosphoribosylanthranilate isomerase [Candidatus Aminicenantes bacterium]
MTKIKVCGLTRAEDVALAVELGADFIGFIFCPDSPRCIHPQNVAALLQAIPAPNVCRVGVFVDQNPETVREIANLCRLDLVQLHGRETPLYCRELGLPHWKALRPRSPGELSLLSQYPDQVILLDTWHPRQKGGTGRPPDTAILQAALKSGRRIVIAGGVGTANLPQLLNMSPWALDVNSALEHYPGVKDHEAMQGFFRMRREHSQSTKRQHETKKN